jgi:hypothetical protein
VENKENNENMVRTGENKQRTETDLRNTITRFFKDEYKKTGKTPSMATMRRELGVDNKTFYKLFPKGKTELHKLTGIPMDKADFERAAKATQGKKTKKAEIQAKREQTRAEQTRVAQTERVTIEGRKAKYESITSEIDQKTKLYGELKHSALKLAATSEGKKRIFSDIGLMWQFFVDTHHNPSKVVGELIHFCDENGLDRKKTLFEAVSDLERFRFNYHSYGPMPLHEYMEEEVRTHIQDYEEEKEMQRLQKTFEHNLFSMKCPECGRPIMQSNAEFGQPKAHSFIIIQGQIRCSATNCKGVVPNPTCPRCATYLEYGHDQQNREDITFHCPSCEATFRLPQLRLPSNISLAVRI